MGLLEVIMITEDLWVRADKIISIDALFSDDETESMITMVEGVAFRVPLSPREIVNRIVQAEMEYLNAESGRDHDIWR